MECVLKGGPNHGQKVESNKSPTQFLIPEQGVGYHRYISYCYNVFIYAGVVPYKKEAKMERNIGERFTWEGKVIEVCEEVGGAPHGCAKCFFEEIYGVECVRDSVRDLRGFCSTANRTDGRDVYFKEIKEGEMKPSNEMTREDYLKAHRSSGIEEGDIVKVLRRAEGHEQGWGNSWVGRMDRSIGHMFTVLRDCGEDGFYLNTDSILESNFHFPWFVLEITKKKNSCPVDIDDLDLGCVGKGSLKGIINDLIYKDEVNGHALSDFGGVFNISGYLIQEMADDNLSFSDVDTVLELIRRTYREYKKRRQ